VRLPSTDGVELEVHDLGGDGPPLLLCHATGFHGLVWRPVAAELASRFRLWSLDFRGHGLSTPPQGDRGFDWAGFGDDVLSVVDGLGLERPCGLGHSKGGASLLLAEIARPGTFAGLWVYEPVVFPPPEGPPQDESPLAAGAARRREVFPSRQAAFENYAGKPPFSVLRDDALAAYVEHGFGDEPDGTVRLRCRPEHESQVYRMGGVHHAWDGLPGVACPTTVACGGVGATIDAALAARMVERLPDGRVEEFAHLGHFGPLEDPTAIAAAAAAALLPAAPGAAAG
jgi:pimeloyl-ACP methyl ester carboxylesterase